MLVNPALRELIEEVWMTRFHLPPIPVKNVVTAEADSLDKKQDGSRKDAGCYIEVVNCLLADSLVREIAISILFDTFLPTSLLLETGSFLSLPYYFIILSAAKK